MAQENREVYIAWLREKLEDYCNDDGSYEVYWDYDDSITPDQLVEAVDNWKSEGYTSPESYLASTLYDTVGEAQESQLYVSILCGDLVAVGFDFETGENRDLSVDEMSRVADYFTEVSKPGSGIEEVIAIRMGQRREEVRSKDGRVTLKGEAQASRAASEKLAEGRDTGSPALDDHSIV